MHFLYENLKARKTQFHKALRSEFIAFDIRSGPSDLEEDSSSSPNSQKHNNNSQCGSNPNNLTTGSRSNEENGIQENDNNNNNNFTGGEEGDCASEMTGENITHTAEVNTEYLHSGDVNPEEEGSVHTQQVSLQSDDVAKFIHYGSHDTIAERLNAIFMHGGVAKEAICVCVMEYVETFMSTRWIKSAHLALLVACFKDGTVMRTDFGSYRVELIVLLYTRLIDIHNFEFVLMNLTATEHAAVIARIGLLNLFNPWKPEGAFQLDLSRWEERQIAKMLAHLSIIEPVLNNTFFFFFFF